jgi:pimeloyl-ACP methyl ester carboxylesterase
MNRVAYVERGKGPAAIFLHGYPLNGFQWRGALPRLGRYRRGIAFDFMGLGYTETAETQDLSPAAQADMVAILLDALSINAADIVANDSGGAVAQMFVAKCNAGASLEHYSLCRCGHSQNKPFCSGMHWYVRFHDPISSPDHQPTLFEWTGGLPALTRMTRLFYSKHVPEDPLIGVLFARMSPDHPERVAAWLGEVFGGPKVYSTRYGGAARAGSA